MKAQATTTTKQVTILARYEIKRNGHIVYTVRSSTGVDTYNTTLVAGKATGCGCASRKPCYHMAGCEQRERERTLAHLREQSETRLEQVDQETQAYIAQELEQAASRKHTPSEQAALASLPEKRHIAPLNGSRAFSFMR